MNNMQNHRKQFIWLGYAYHASKCYWLQNHKSISILVSWDMIFLNKSFGDQANVKDTAIFPWTTKEIPIIDEFNELYTHNLIPSDNRNDNKNSSYDDDDNNDVG